MRTCFREKAREQGHEVRTAGGEGEESKEGVSCSTEMQPGSMSFELHILVSQACPLWGALCATHVGAW